MQIKLLPPAPHPTVLFAITFPNPQPCLPIPHSYTTLVHTLNTSHPQLDLPNSVYALDKATYILELLSEVIFDMSTGEVKCIWVDGVIDAWDLRIGEKRSTWELEGGVGQMLESVLADVNMSAEESEWEKLREEWDKYRAAEVEARANADAQVQIAAIAAAVPVIKSKHKKQRSLLMTLVASLVPSPSPPLPQINLTRLPFASPTPPSQPTVQLVPPSPHPPPPAPPPDLSSRHLRRRARSTLVDAWRRYVLSELTSREKSRGGGEGGYQDWIVRSMLRGTEEGMEEIVQANGGVVPDILESPSQSPKGGGRFRFDVPSSPSFSDYEDEGGDEGPGDSRSLSTDTDGSSIHTPASTHPVTPTAPSSPLTQEDIETYTVLHTTALQLRALQQRLVSLSSRQKAEERSAMSVLEIKARRRAWGNGVLRKEGGGHGHGVGGLGGLGLGVPTRTSSLRMSVSAADFQKQAEEHQHMQASVEGPEGIVDASFCLSRSRTTSPVEVSLDVSHITDDLRNVVFDDPLPITPNYPLTSAKMNWILGPLDSVPVQPQRLFPVLEETESDLDSLPFELRETGWDYERDLEAGLLHSSNPLDRPQIRPRTRSMHPTLGIPALTIPRLQLQAPRSKKEGRSPVVCQPLPSLPPPTSLVRHKAHPTGTRSPRLRQSPALVGGDSSDQQVELQFFKPPSPPSPPPPYNARNDEERRVRERRLFEYELEMDEDEMDLVLEDCGTSYEDGVGEFGLKLKLDNKPRLVEGRNIEVVAREDHFVGGIV